MAWKALDRNAPIDDPQQPERLDDAIVAKIEAVLPRYAQKRAALLPALHIVQDAMGYVPPRLVPHIAEVLEITPADVFDTLSFYTHFWTTPKGRKVVTICRSLTCQLMGADRLIEETEQHLGCSEGGTSDDGEYSILVEECIAACEKAPCAIIGEKLHGPIAPGEVGKLLDDPRSSEVDMPRCTTFCKPD